MALGQGEANGMTPGCAICTGHRPSHKRRYFRSSSSRAVDSKRRSSQAVTEGDEDQPNPRISDRIETPSGYSFGVFSLLLMDSGCPWPSPLQERAMDGEDQVFPHRTVTGCETRRLFEVK